MNGKAIVKFFAAIALIIGCFVYSIVPLASSLKQGLDLQGGTHIVLEAEDTANGVADNDAVERAKQILERRINEMGLSEPLVQREGARRIIIELPGVKDPDEAMERIGKTAVLEFKNEQGETVMTGDDLKDAKEELGPNKQPLVAIELSDEGARRFADLTAKNIGRRIAITLDGKELTNPVVQQAITGGRATISGSATLQEAKDLAILLRSGALPVKINVLEIRTVGPSLGQDSKDKSVVAFGVGIGLIMVFLLVLYRLSGFVANVALLVYVMLLLLVLGKGFDATLTLPGIAGIILSMGVAVDANILIFERFKEEVFTGKSMRVAIEAGFNRALSTITDANVSVMITAGILVLLGSGPVKGFAINLGLGVLVSMFTAILVSRFLLRLLIDCNFTNHPFWFGANVSPFKSAEEFAPAPKVLKGGKSK
ncbi:protein translocase subunit SecD [Veillonella agrestimuris]|uniref:protein translocase subunit SecD n=1 Tax=Veillonella agrestimuris TaxID=2941340 RepID=UPI00203B6750|nr:protein translocase subunit SecD [Veillonella agrestimuris]